MAEVTPPRKFSRIYSLDAPENLYLQDTKTKYTYYIRQFGLYDFWESLKERGYKGIEGHFYVSRETYSKLLDSISTSYYGENELFVEGQDSTPRAQLIYRLKRIRAIHTSSITQKVTDISKDFTITYCSYEKYMKERPKKMEKREDYIYAVTKPLDELTEEDYKWMGWDWTVNDGEITLKYTRKYTSYNSNLRLIVEGNDTIKRIIIYGL